MGQKAQDGQILKHLNYHRTQKSKPRQREIGDRLLDRRNKDKPMFLKEKLSGFSNRSWLSLEFQVTIFLKTNENTEMK